MTKSFTAGVELAESQDHYDDSADSPAWTQTKTRTDGEAAWETTWQRYLSVLGGGLGLSVDDAGVVKVQLANLHGDIVSTLTIGQAGLDSYSESDEYGRASDPAAAQPRYGWLGVHQRDTGGTLAGLTLMGARLYNPVTGRFLSIDPVPGGNDNRYTYPCDPVNKLDLNGEWSLSDTAGALGLLSTVAGLLPAAICAVCGAVSAVLGVTSAALYAVDGNYGEASAQLVGTAVGLVFGGARFAVKISQALRLAKVSGKAGRALRWLNRGGAQFKYNKALRAMGKGVPKKYKKLARAGYKWHAVFAGNLGAMYSAATWARGRSRRYAV